MPRIAEITTTHDGRPCVVFEASEDQGCVSLYTPGEVNRMIAAARRALVRGMLEPLPNEHTVMILAASKIPLEHENGGLEYPPFKVFNAMLRAYAQCNEIIPQDSKS